MAIHFDVDMYNKLTELEKMEFAQWVEQEGLHDCFDFQLDGRVLTGLKFSRDNDGHRHYDPVKKEAAWEEFTSTISQQPPISFFRAVARMRQQEEGGV